MGEQAMNEVVYTSESRLGHPGQLLREMLADLRASRELAWRLMLRNIRVQYRRSFLGAAWSFIPALATAVALTLATKARIINVGDTFLPYPAYVLFGMTLWQTFLDALNGPVQALAAETSLLAKFNVAPEAIVVSKLGEALFNCLVRSVLVVAALAWYQVPLGWTALFAPLAVAAIIVLGAGIGLFLAPLSALYQDVTKTLAIVTSFGFFLTPIVYPVPTRGLFALVVNLNPVTPLLVTTRELVTGRTLSQPVAFAAVTALAIVLLLAGWIAYRVSMPIVLERSKS
jgi:lipopolysaccharide transport system permease protein